MKELRDHPGMRASPFAERLPAVVRPDNLYLPEGEPSGNMLFGRKGEGRRKLAMREFNLWSGRP